MRYQDDIAKSAEYMRSAITLMAKQNAGFHPISYSVWYEFVSGINSGLKQAIDQIASKGEVLDDAMTAALFRKYIAELDLQSAQRISAGFQKVLSGVSASTSAVREQTFQYSHSLEQLQDNMTETSELSTLLAGMNQVLGNTREMQNAIVSLQERLSKSQQEIESLRQEVTRTRTEALSDSLTGLPNRRGFDVLLTKFFNEIQHEGRQPSLIVMDIDNFKAMNDTYGHLFGDKVIASIAQLLKQNIKGRDTVARYGGEEFIILLPETSLQGALVVAEAIRSTVEKSRVKRNQDNTVVSNITLSLGVATLRKGETMADFMGRADQAMCHSKQQGRNRVTAETSHLKE